jgi:microcystin-dependent protein
VGNAALYLGTTGTNNTAVGNGAMYYTSGSGNSAFGVSSLYSNTTGNNNIAVGINALYSNTSASNLVAVGDSALFNNTSGTGNTAVGNQALAGNITGSYNTVLGYSADVSGSNLTNAAAIGYQAKVSASNAMVLGGTGTYAVNVGIGTTAPQNQLDVFTTTGGINAISGINTGLLNGVGWGPGENYSGLSGRSGNGSVQYSAGVYGYQIGSGVNSGGVVGAFSAGLWGALGYTDNASNIWGVYSQGNLNVQGHVQILDGTQAAGKVLTSDANGNGSWDTIPKTPTVSVKFCIVAFGVFPTQGSGNFTTPVIGEIFPFAGNFAPSGTLFCNGQLISIASNNALFSILGITYGGNGTTNFALPNLNGLTAVPVGY